MENIKKILRTWLFHQCQMLSEARHAVLLTGAPDEGPYDQTLFWPNERQDHSALSSAPQLALLNKKGVIRTRNNAVEETGEPLDALACPLFLGRHLLGVVAIEMTNRSPQMQLT